MYEEQQAEVELLEAAFGSSFQLVADDSSLISYIIQLCDYKCSIQFWLPIQFPRVPLMYSIMSTDRLISSSLLVKIKETLDSEILTHNKGYDGSQFRSMDCYQFVSNSIYDHLHNSSNINDVKVEDYRSVAKHSNTHYSYQPILNQIRKVEIKIARFLIYFHHIMRYLRCLLSY